MVPAEMDSKRAVFASGLFALTGLLAATWQPAFCKHPPAGQEARVMLRSGGLDREFLYYLPANLPKGEAVPLVFVYHGGGGEARRIMNLTAFNSVADRGRFIAVYPQGVGKSWNDGRVTKVSQAHREKIDDVAFFDVMLQRLSEDHRIDPRRVFVTGISNGGIFAHFLAAHRSEKIAAIAPITGGIAEPFDRQFNPTHPVAVLMIQGTEDPLVPFDGGRIAGWAGKDRGRIIGTEQAARLWLAANGIKSQPIKKLLPDRDPMDGCRVESIEWSGGRGGSEVRLYRVDGGGHTWPGGIQYLPRAIIGRVTHDIDSEAIWEFFANHPKQE